MNTTLHAGAAYDRERQAWYIEASIVRDGVTLSRTPRQALATQENGAWAVTNAKQLAVVHAHKQGFTGDFGGFHVLYYEPDRIHLIQDVDLAPTE